MDTPSTTVASYIRDLFLPPDPQLEAALQRAAAAGLRSIQVPPELGRLLGILVQATGARRVLEIGTLGGYSAIHISSLFRGESDPNRCQTSTPRMCLRLRDIARLDAYLDEVYTPVSIIVNNYVDRTIVNIVARSTLEQAGSGAAPWHTSTSQSTMSPTSRMSSCSPHAPRKVSVSSPTC